jgi:acetylglutamate kinase
MNAPYSHSPEAAEKARVLAEALPYIQRFHGKTIVVKFGGNAMTEETLKEHFAYDVVLLKLVGMNPVVVHGGGPQIEDMLTRLGKKGEFVQGMRVTDNETLDIVEMVLSKVNKEVVELINQAGGKAVGLTGQDGNFIRAKKMVLPPSKDNAANGSVDLGQVGEVESIDPSVIQALESAASFRWSRRSAPAPTAPTYNINADLVAGKLAEILRAEKAGRCSPTRPACSTRTASCLTGLTPRKIDDLVAKGVISGGMLPKIGSALDAARNGVKSVHIIDGRVPHALLLEVLTDQGVGTLIRSK